MRQIISFSGKAGVGKTLCASYLSQKYGFKTMAFAHLLKKLAVNWFFWDGKKDDKGRKFLQDLGNLARAYSVNTWVKHLEKAIFESRSDRIVIDDCRYRNEIKWVKDQKGITIRVNRKNILLSGDAARHQSEIDLDDYEDFDYVINNNLDKLTLFQKLDKIVPELIE